MNAARMLKGLALSSVSAWLWIAGLASPADAGFDPSIIALTPPFTIAGSMTPANSNLVFTLNDGSQATSLLTGTFTIQVAPQVVGNPVLNLVVTSFSVTGTPIFNTAVGLSTGTINYNLNPNAPSTGTLNETTGAFSTNIAGISTFSNPAYVAAITALGTPYPFVDVVPVTGVYTGPFPTGPGQSLMGSIYFSGTYPPAVPSSITPDSVTTGAVNVNVGSVSVPITVNVVTSNGNSIPEPSSLILSGIGLLAALARARRQPGTQGGKNLLPR